MVWTCPTYCDVTTVTCPCRPTERINEGGGWASDGLWSDLRDDATLVRVCLIQQQLTRRQSTQRYKREQVTKLLRVQTNVIVSSKLFQPFILCINVTFSIPFRSPHIFVFFPSVQSLFFYFCSTFSTASLPLVFLSQRADLELSGLEVWSLLRWKKRARCKIQSKT